MPERKTKIQKAAFIEAARKAEADESESNFEARLKAVAKHAPPLAAIKARKRKSRKAQS